MILPDLDPPPPSGGLVSPPSSGAKGLRGSAREPTCVLVSIRSSLWLRYFSLLLTTWLGAGVGLGVGLGLGLEVGLGVGLGLGLGAGLGAGGVRAVAVHTSSE